MQKQSVMIKYSFTHSNESILTTEIASIIYRNHKHVCQSCKFVCKNKLNVPVRKCERRILPSVTSSGYNLVITPAPVSITWWWGFSMIFCDVPEPLLNLLSHTRSSLEQQGSIPPKQAGPRLTFDPTPRPVTQRRHINTYRKLGHLFL